MKTLGEYVMVGLLVLWVVSPGLFMLYVLMHVPLGLPL